MFPSFDVWSNRKETIKRSASRNIRFIQAAMSVIKSTHLKPYSCKYSKKTYTQYQLLVLVLFKDFRNQHYREFIEDVGDMEQVQDILNLSIVPHFTTLLKFLSRIKSLYLRLTFKKTVNLFYSTDDTIPITAIDSSGFTGFVASKSRVHDTRHAEKLLRKWPLGSMTSSTLDDNSLKTNSLS